VAGSELLYVFQCDFHVAKQSRFNTSFTLRIYDKIFDFARNNGLKMKKEGFG
jgi:hypothetical protein